MLKIKKWAVQDSNLQPMAYEATALTIELTALIYSLLNISITYFKNSLLSFMYSIKVLRFHSFCKFFTFPNMIIITNITITWQI